MNSRLSRIRRLEGMVKTPEDSMVKQKEIEAVLASFEPGKLEELYESFRRFQFVNKYWNEIEPLLPRYKNAKGEELKNVIDISNYSIEDFYQLALKVAGGESH